MAKMRSDKEIIENTKRIMEENDKLIEQLEAKMKQSAYYQSNKEKYDAMLKQFD